MGGAVVNLRLRRRRSRKRSAVRRREQLATIHHHVPCCLGKHHEVRASLRRDGTLLSVESSCTHEHLATEEEISVARSLIGADKFYTCKDVLEDFISAARGTKLTERRRNHYNSNSLNALRAAVYRVYKSSIERREIRDGRGRPWDGDFSTEWRSHTLAMLCTDNRAAVRALGEKRRSIGWRDDIQFRLKLHKHQRYDDLGNVAGEHAEITVWARSYSYQNVKVAVYRGRGRMHVLSEDIDILAQDRDAYGSTDSRGRHPCKVCGRSYTTMSQHVKSEKHKRNFRNAIFDSLEQIAARLDSKPKKDRVRAQLGLAQDAQGVVE